MDTTVRRMNAACFPIELADREKRWRQTVYPAYGETRVVLNATGPSELPAGTHLVIESTQARMQTVVVERNGVPLYDTLKGASRPSTAVVLYREMPTGVEVGVVYQGRHLDDIPFMQPLCDANGYVLCAEPPGGVIDDVGGQNFLDVIPPREVIEACARNEIDEEFGRVKIVSLDIQPLPIVTLGMIKTSTIVVFAKSDPTVAPEKARPEVEELIVGAKFLPLEQVLDNCLAQQKDGIFWGRQSAASWWLFERWLRRRGK